MVQYVQCTCNLFIYFCIFFPFLFCSCTIIVCDCLPCFGEQRCIYVLPVNGGHLDLPFTPTSEIIYISSSVLLDPENVRVAIGISLLSCIKAEIFVIAYVLTVYGSHLWFTSHRDVRIHLHLSQRVAGPRKCVSSRWNFVAILDTSWVIRIWSLQATILGFPLSVSSCLIVKLLVTTSIG